MMAIRFLIKEIALNGHLQSLGAAGIVYLAASALSVPASFSVLLLTYLLLQIVYFFDRFTDLSRDWSGNEHRSAHIASFQNRIPYIMAAYAALAGSVILYDASPAGMAFAFLIVVCGVLYPRLFKPLTVYIPLFKNLYVAATFSILVLFPFFYSAHPLPSYEALGFVALFIFISALTAQFILDLKDVSADREQGLKTLPVLIGRKGTIGAAVAIGLLATVLFLLSPLPLLGYLSLGGLCIDFFAIMLLQQGRNTGSIAAAAKFGLLWLLILFF